MKGDMGADFMTAENTQYKVEFLVWPSQEAYDIIAKLNNGTLTYGDTTKYPQKVWDQIGGNSSSGYYLITNESDAGFSYTLGSNVNGNVTTLPGVLPTDTSDPNVQGGNIVVIQNPDGSYTYKGTFKPVANLNLLPDKISVKKTFVNHLDPDVYPGTSIHLDVVPADNESNLFKRIELTSSNNWESNDNYISPGLMKTSGTTLTIFEYGHDFKLKEVDYHWDLVTGVFRPVIVDNQLKVLERTGDYSGTAATVATSGGVTTYQIPSHTDSGGHLVAGGTYKEVAASSAQFSATNYRRSNLNLKKNVVDEAGNILNGFFADELFEFKLKVTPGEEVWFSVYEHENDPSSIILDLTTNATPEIKNSVKTGYYYAANGTEVTVSLKPGWNLRITNLPTGSPYEITESDSPDGFDFVKAELTTGTDTSFIPQSASAAKTSGKIQNNDTQYLVTYSNKCTLSDITIYKTDAGSPPTSIAGAVFSLFKKNGSKYDSLGADYTNFEIPTSGKTFSRLAIGQYKLEEISAPQGYVVQNKETYFTLNAADPVIVLDSAEPPQSWASVTGDKDEILVIQNEAGAALPATGGPGTLAYTLSGIALVIGSALMYGFRMRHGERRLK